MSNRYIFSPLIVPSEAQQTLNINTIKTLTIAVVAIVCIGGAAAVTMRDGVDSTYSDNGTSAVKVDGIEPAAKRVTDGTYEIQRNLILATKGEPTGNVKLFIDWIRSTEGQEILKKAGFVALSEPVAKPPAPTGEQTIAVGGSTTIQPAMALFKEAYEKQYPYVTVEITSGGSGAGANGTISGTLDIGMCSRDLKASEMSAGLVPTVIGHDGVAVIVNGAGVGNLTLEQIAKIYDGTYTNWKQVGGADRSIAVIARDESSGTRECFDTAMKSVVGGWNMKTYASFLNSTGAVISQVNTVSGSIGYVSIGALEDLRVI